jgi:folate-binding protein YgfZ
MTKISPTPAQETFIFFPNQPQHVSWAQRWIALGGPDARDFLHRLTTARARALNPGEGTPAAFLSAQGKIRSTFSLWCLDESEFGFEVPTGADLSFHRELLAAIDQYTFAEKMSLADIPTDKLECVWIFPSSEHSWSQEKPLTTRALEDEVRLNFHGSRDFTRPWISAWGRPERLRQWQDREFGNATIATSAQVNLLRVAACRPWVGHEITSAVTPLDIGLPDAVAENKGCYPGQEVIEKIAALGSPARRLVRATTAEPSFEAPLGSPLFSLGEGQTMELGEITSAAPGEFLAIVRKTHARPDAEFRIGSEGPNAKVIQVAPYLTDPEAKVE